ncbi:MAG: winged helix-turn-helix domain-containing protein [Candidatus Eremiobacteraeota bacterium]|nr:winged helix-turn-helix domain-containing protein [Candidatus Eremiobacteraeota bacterium]
MNQSKSRDFQKGSILSISEKMLKKNRQPLTYRELFDVAIEKGYQNKEVLEKPAVFGQRVKEDIKRRQGESIFQIVGFRQVGLKEWGLPDFDLEEYKRNIQEEARKNKKVSVIAATIEALKKTGRPMRVKEIFEYVINHDKVKFKSKTPFKTVNSNITHEINRKGKNSRFVRISRGLIDLKKRY